ncbi:MAG: hypothetical protein ACXWQR_15850 [Ktedonobacterales bacterium]
MSYLNRYLQGEHEAVWDELHTLGAEIYNPSLYGDTLGVARETMRRVRANIEMLILRLAQTGFVFGYDHLLLQTVAHPLSGRKADCEQYMEALRWSREQPPLFLPARMGEQGRTETREAMDWEGLEGVLEELLEAYDIYPDMPKHFREVESMIGRLPLSLRVWYEEVGAVNFYGYHPRWSDYVDMGATMTYGDPLQLCVLDDAHMAHLRERHQRGQLHAFEFAPDPYFKDYTAGSSTPFSILPSDAIDGELTSYPSRPTFVHYLRLCMRWAGFPGMAEWSRVPEDDIAFCTRDLLPF